MPNPLYRHNYKKQKVALYRGWTVFKATFRGRYLFYNNFPIALFIFVIFVRKPFLTDDYEKISNKFDVLTELLAIIRGDSVEIAKFVLYILICKLPSSYWISQSHDWQTAIFNPCFKWWSQNINNRVGMTKWWATHKQGIEQSNMLCCVMYKHLGHYTTVG